MRPPDAKATTKNVQWDHRPSIHMRRKMAVGTARAQVTRALRTATEMLLTAFARNTPRASPHTTHARRNGKAAGKRDQMPFQVKWENMPRATKRRTRMISPKNSPGSQRWAAGVRSTGFHLGLARP